MCPYIRFLKHPQVSRIPYFVLLFHLTCFEFLGKPSQKVKAATAIFFQLCCSPELRAGGKVTIP